MDELLTALDRAAELQASADYEVGFTVIEWAEFVKICQGLDFYRIARMLRELAAAESAGYGQPYDSPAVYKRGLDRT